MANTLEFILKARDEASKKLQGLSKTMGSVGKVAAGLGVAFGSVGILNFAKDSVKAAAEFEQTGIAFEVMLKSADKAKKLMSDIQAFAIKTPFQQKDLEVSTKKLLAYGVELDKVLPTMQKLGDVSAITGKEKLPQLITAFGQVKAAGRLMGTELRQFTETGVPLIENLAAVTGYSAEEISQKVGDLKIPFSKVEEAFARMTSEGGLAFNAMTKLSDSLGGKMSNLEDIFDIFKRTIGQAMAGPIEEITISLMNFFKGAVGNMGGFKNAFENAFNFVKGVLSEFKSSFLEPAGKALQWLGEQAGKILDEIKVHFDKNFGFIKKILGDSELDIQKLIAVGLGMIVLVGVMSAISAAVGLLGLAVAALTSPWVLVTLAITAAVYAWQTNLGGFRNFVQLLILGITQSWEQFKLYMQLAGASISLVFNTLSLNAAQTAADILGSFALLPGASENVKQMAEQAKLHVQGMKDQINTDIDFMANFGAEKAALLKDQAIEHIQVLSDMVPTMTNDMANKAIEKIKKLADESNVNLTEMSGNTKEIFASMADNTGKSATEMRAIYSRELTALELLIEKSTGEQKKTYQNTFDLVLQKSKAFGTEYKKGTAQNIVEATKEINKYTAKMGIDIVDIFTNLGKSTIKETQAMKIGVTGEVTNTANNVKTEMSAPANQSSNWGSHLILNFARGMASSMPALQGQVNEAKAIQNQIHQSYNPELPAKLWGQHLLENFANGMKDTQPKLFAETEEVKALIKKQFGNDGELMAIMKDFDKDEATAQRFQEIYDKIIEKAKEMADKVEDIHNSYQDLNIKAGEELVKLKDTHAQTMDDISGKLEQLKGDLSGLKDAYNTELGGINKGVAEKILDQEGLVAKLQEEISKKQEELKSKGGESSGVDNSIADLQSRLTKEQSALESFMLNATEYEDALSEARRRASLTDFERFIEDTNAKKEKALADYQEKKAQMDQEVADLQNQKLQETLIYEQKIAEYEKIKNSFDKMQKSLSQGLDFLATDTEGKVRRMISQLEALKQKMDAVGVSQSPTLTDQFTAAPIGNTIPLSSTSQPIGGNTVQINMGDVNINDGTDKEQFFSEMEQRLTRSIELQKIGSI